MKLTTFLICGALIQVSAKGYSQVKLSLDYTAVSLNSLLDSIEKKSDYTFVYNNKLTGNTTKVDVRVKDKTVPEILARVLLPMGLDYKIMSDKMIVILSASAEQAFKVTGKVTDKNGMPLIGVTVKVDGAAVGTTTDAQGAYTLAASEKGALVFSFIGYLPQRVMIENRPHIDVILQEDTKGLNEVVVTAMGITRQKRSLTYAVSEVKAAEIMHAGADNIGSALVGKLPGVDLVGMTGGPMNGTRINIRGINSIDGNSRPLIVLDGIPITDNDDSFAGRGGGNNAKGSLLNYINPDDIETITVLKGANAAALYGSQALNGVLVITTKKGKSGKKGLGVEVYSDYTYNQRAFMPEYQNEYGSGTTPYFTTFAADGTPIYTGTSTLNFGPKLDGRTVQWWDGQKRPWVGQPDNFKDIFQDGYTNSNRVSVNGSNDKSFFRLSVTNFNYGGFMPNMKQGRNSLSFASGYQISSRIKVDVQLMYNNINNTNPPQRIDRASNYPMARNEITSLYESNYKNALGYYMTDSIRKISSNFRDNILRPLFWDQLENRYTSNQQQILGSVTATIELAKPLSLRLRYGTNRYFNLNETKEKWLQVSDPTNAADLQGNYSRTLDNSYRNYVEALLTYNKSISKDFKLSLTAGASGDDSYGYVNTSYVRGLRFRDIFSLNNNKAVDNNAPRGSDGGERYMAVFGSGQLGFRDWLFLDVTGRNDWSSKLPVQNRSYFYPSVGLSYILSEAVKLPEVINYMKFRGSYAQVGNTVPSRYFANEGYTYTNYSLPDGTFAVKSSVATSVPPLDIRAEKNYSLEFGMEAAFIDNRLKLDLTYYSNKGVDLINAVNVTPSSGASSIRINSGSISNKGIEIQLKGDIVRGKDFGWQATLNGTQIKRKVLSLADGIKERVIGNPFSAVFKAVPGDAPYDIYMNKIARDAKTGKPLVDANGLWKFDGALSNMGNALPKWYGGFINDFNYKNFLLTIAVDYRYGGKIVSYSNTLMNGAGVSKESLYGRDTEHGGISFYTNDAGKNIRLANGEQPPAGKVLRTDGMLIDGIKPDGTPNDLIVSAANYYNSRYGGFATEDAVFDNNYIRLGEISLAYRLPNNICQKLSVQNVTFSLIARNIAYLYKSLPNVTPNSGLGTDAINSNFEYSAFPSVRNLGGSVKVNF
ncbi:SusC/RagA family TonB-linked outer membrane protein [Chitinophaga sp. sic0106]|uniref:SusC/RagA family TonB-linked outer membrane protein n=1 Tax=Chitinophaga sp. sic0106 TaxID=2854785 RepID=UPI001C44D302|nr:SusC/RagA family TonB-linked outer membrane protein [Chitinophaga sp. sic0106]MBV7530657.1 SusC/RagA family TonB-linked outer membrane protein [Chitinophaga sp. sic0106]